MERNSVVPLKASIVYRMIPFVTWPTKNLESENPTRVSICTDLSETNLKVWKALLEGESIAGKAIHVLPFSKNEDLARCQILHLTKVDASVLCRAIRRGVLTIVENDEWLEKGGIVSMKILEGHVSLDISLGMARKYSFDISSKLLRLSKNVIRDPYSFCDEEKGEQVP